MDENEIEEVVDSQPHPSGIETSTKMPKPPHLREVYTNATWPQDVIAFPCPNPAVYPRCFHTILQLHVYSTSNIIQEEGHVCGPYYS